MKNLFAYGTLICEDIMLEVSGCSLPYEPGILKGYSRWLVKGEHYPAVMPDKEGIVEGVVYRDVPRSAWDRLDRFEGDMYKRQAVNVELNDGTMLSAETYVIQPKFLCCLDSSDWDFDNFMATGKTKFQRHYKGYRSL